jgi:quinol monooxygenase YgiN
MTTKYIVELKTKAGKRDQLKTLLDTLMADLGPSLKEKGALGSTFYEVLDDPDMLVEIADWESAEARDAVMQDPRTGEALAPVLELLAGPFEATPLRPA